MEQHCILITGGAGFIGSHVVRHFVTKYPHYTIVNLDLLTYAGNLDNLRDIEDRPNYRFVQGDIGNASLVSDLLRRYRINGIINLAAESHVDRSIKDPLLFLKNNVLGMCTLMEAAREYWSSRQPSTSAPFAHKVFYQVSTDEVYGALAEGDRPFTEECKYDPHSPYSASKASCDHFVRAYRDTFGLPILISNCSNNYGPYQFPEKLIPLFINNIKEQRPLPLYGTGQNVRDWLHVQDHARAIDLIYHKGKPGQTYNIGGFNERTNLQIARELISITDRILGRAPGASDSLLTFVADRAGHDLRYAIDSAKLRTELGWAPDYTFSEGLEQTVKWYLAHPDWLARVTSGAYRDYYKEMYEGRR